MSVDHWLTVAACILFAIFIIAFAAGTHSFDEEDIKPVRDTYHGEDEPE
jgi:hypothetical protein